MSGPERRATASTVSLPSQGTERPEAAKTIFAVPDGAVVTTGTSSSAGPCARSRMPGLRWSSIQRVPRLPGRALTITEIDSGREGEEAMV